MKKKGRPTNVERLVRERALSVSSMEGIEEMLGRKGKKGVREGEKRERFFKGVVRRREHRRRRRWRSKDCGRR